MKILAVIEFRSAHYHFLALKEAISTQNNPTFIMFHNVFMFLVLKHPIAFSSDLEIPVIFRKWASFGGCPLETKGARNPEI